MSKKRKLPGVPGMVPRKYHHEIKCVMQQFQSEILCDILKNGKLDDEAFMEVVKFSDFAGTPIGVLKMIKDVPGNEVSKRLYGIMSGLL